ncbi:MAG: hypothetical protein LBU91_00695 [Bacteroidales bacterium]|nr:hypothetical protein [Bacteroidales bacterium]
MKTLFFTFLAIIFNVSCGFCQTDQELKNILTKGDTAWLNSWKEEPLKTLKKIENKSITPHNYNGFYNYDLNSPDTSFYVFSPNKMFCIDIYSRTISIEDSLLVYYEHDSEILLNDLTKKTSLSLAFCGSYCSFHEVRWISDSCFIVLGIAGGCPHITVFDIKNLRYTSFESLINTQKYNYVEEKFKLKKVINGIKQD